MYRDIALQATDLLSEFEEVQKVILYGSVCKGTAHSGSDIDLAIICNDFMRSFPMDSEGLPSGLIRKVEDALEPLKRQYCKKIHLGFYWETEFDNGINLGRDMLDDNCEILYDSKTSVAN